MTELPMTMKALRVERAPQRYYTLTELPVPRPTGTEVLLRLGAAGFCHTDLMVKDGAFAKARFPVTASHEPAGTVVALGEGARALGTLRQGDRVAALLPRRWCGKCPSCVAVDWKYCPNSAYTGINEDGAFAEYGIYDARTCVVLPDTMDFDQAAALTCAGVTIYTAIKKAALEPGQVLAIVGLGALGSLGVQMARTMGLKVVGVDARPEPIALVESFALRPDIAVDATQVPAEELAQRVRQELRPNGYVGFAGADAVILTSDPPSSQRYALDLARQHGLYIVVSQPATLELAYTDVIFRGLTVVGSLHGNERDLAECVALCAAHGIRSAITRFAMGEHERMVDTMDEPGRKGKAVLVF